jgi:hypothetical protein
MEAASRAAADPHLSFRKLVREQYRSFLSPSSLILVRVTPLHLCIPLCDAVEKFQSVGLSDSSVSTLFSALLLWSFDDKIVSTS